MRFLMFGKRRNLLEEAKTLEEESQEFIAGENISAEEEMEFMQQAWVKIGHYVKKIRQHQDVEMEHEDKGKTNPSRRLRALQEEVVDAGELLDLIDSIRIKLRNLLERRNQRHLQQYDEAMERMRARTAAAQQDHRRQLAEMRSRYQFPPG